MAILALIPGMFALGFFTNWDMGIGPLEPWMAGIIDWFQLAQLGGGLLVAILGLRAWWKPVVKSEEMVSNVRQSRKRREKARTASSVQLPRFRPPQFHLPESWTSRPKGNGRLKLSGRARAQERSMPEVEKVIVARPAKSGGAKRSRKSSQRKPELQFSVYEEHRCPYCLEEVKRNDPRGVKECDICHTLHHADCWNITGICQIPHLNSLNT
jgi:ribosomal protein L37AE/L43A